MADISVAERRPSSIDDRGESEARDEIPPDAAGGPAIGRRLEPIVAVGAAATLGAAVIHFAFALPHLAESGRDGTFFLVVGWFQLAAAVGLAFGAAPRRAWLAGTAALNAAVVAVWLVSRTVGVPGSHDEGVGFPDGVATGLEVVAVVAAVAVLAGRRATGRLARPSPWLLAVPGVALVALVTASVTPALAGDHASGGGGGHAHGDGGGEAASGAGHEHTPAGEDWSAQRLAALSGYLPADELASYRETHQEYLAGQIRERSDVLAELPEAEREERIATFVDWVVDNALLSENGGAAEGEETMHSHGPSEWQAVTDPADQTGLHEQLRTAGDVIPRVRTAADAVAAGYHQVTPYVPGIGAHYLNVRLIRDGFDPAAPEMLLYNGNRPDSELVGFSYASWGGEAPEGFVGSNDVWHRHPSLCTIGTFVVGPDHTSEEMCASVGGQKGTGGELWMAHLWQVPGWESPWGLFSGENPTLNMATTDAAT